MTCRRLGSFALVLLGLIPASSGWSQDRPVVAVFDLENKGARFKAADMERLTEYLSTTVTATGRFQVVPLNELKAVLSRQKKESYKECYDESCQIDIGKELAAEKTLAGSISRFGKSCLVTLKMFDLAKSTAEAAGAARGGCTEDDVLTTLEKAVAQLTGGRAAADRRRAPPPPVTVATPKVEGGQYGDLDAEMRAAAESAARQVAERRGREEAARRDWRKIEAFVKNDKVAVKRRVEVLDKFLRTFPTDNPHAADAQVVLQSLQNVVGMVRIPEGSFTMGCNQTYDKQCDSDEKPPRTVRLAAYSIDQKEVTVDDYKQCVNAGGCNTRGVTMPYEGNKTHPARAWACNWGKAGKGRYPMNCVSHSHARDFCRWKGKRLPTGAEWEKAARGTDGRVYPWGNNRPSGGMKVGNVSDEAAKRTKPNWNIMVGYDDGYYGPAPVGLYPQGKSPYGVEDMFGNVWEWTADPAKGGKRNLRGCSYSSRPKLCRLSNIKWLTPETRRGSYGFRCAK